MLLPCLWKSLHKLLGNSYLGCWLKCSGQPQIVCESLIPVLCLLLPSQASVTLFLHTSTSSSNLSIVAPSLLSSAKDTAYYSRWSSAHPDAGLSPPTLYPDQLVWPLYSMEDLMLLSFLYWLWMLYKQVITDIKLLAQNLQNALILEAIPCLNTFANKVQGILLLSHITT